MAVHLLIVDALNLIRRIHAVQGSPCVDTCLHALEQLIVHSQPTHAVAVFDDEDRGHGWRHQRLPDYKAGRAPMPETLEAEMPALRAAADGSIRALKELNGLTKDNVRVGQKLQGTRRYL